MPETSKYESRRNRISASGLYLVREALDTAVPEFFSDFYRKQKSKGIMEVVESGGREKPAGHEKALWKIK